MTTSPFKEFRLVLPVKAGLMRTAHSTVRDRVEMDLLDHFGGYTRTDGIGGWWSESQQKSIEEPIHIYDVGSDCSIKSQHRVTEIVRLILRHTDEEAVYYRDHTGVVHIMERN